jgi:hypothetical protein
MSGCTGGIGMAKSRFMSIGRPPHAAGGVSGYDIFCQYERVETPRVRGVACIANSVREPDDALDGPVFLEEEWVQA